MSGCGLGDWEYICFYWYCCVWWVVCWVCRFWVRYCVVLCLVWGVFLGSMRFFWLLLMRGLVKIVWGFFEFCRVWWSWWMVWCFWWWWWWGLVGYRFVWSVDVCLFCLLWWEKLFCFFWWFVCGWVWCMVGSWWMWVLVFVCVGWRFCCWGDFYGILVWGGDCWVFYLVVWIWRWCC